MRRLQKLDLISTIGRELQDSMTFSDVENFFVACDVDPNKPWSGTNSKWVYAKEILADETDKKILEIADELGIVHGLSISKVATSAADATFWTPSYFRLFISHTSKHKFRAAKLQVALRSYGITGFVAHEDIEPTKVWQEEIEKGLFSMDALAAILTPDFNESKWTDHEVGVAVGRETVVVPIRSGLDPYGFIGKFQGYQASGKKVRDVAHAVFMILAANPQTRTKLAEILVEQLLAKSSSESDSHWLSLLEEFKTIPKSPLERLRANAADIQGFVERGVLHKRIDKLLAANGIEKIDYKPPPSEDFDDDIPF